MGPDPVCGLFFVVRKLRPGKVAALTAFNAVTERRHPYCLAVTPNIVVNAARKPLVAGNIFPAIK